MQYVTMAEFIALPDKTKELIRNNYQATLGSKITFEDSDDFYIVKNTSDFQSDILHDATKCKTFIPWLSETDLREMLERLTKSQVKLTARRIVFGSIKFKRKKEGLMHSYLDALTNWSEKSRRIKWEARASFVTNFMVWVCVGILCSAIVFPSIYEMNFTHLKNIVFIEEVLTDDYIDQEAFEQRMKDVLGKDYHADDQERFYKYATEVILADVSKAHGDEFYERWGKYNFWISQDTVDKWDQSDEKKTAGNIYEPYEGTDAFYIKFNTFSDLNADNQFLSHVDEMKKYSTIIVDLRNNGGGYVSVANNIADAFIDKDALLVSFENTNSVEEYFAKTARKLNQKVLVLMNDRTASASEIFILALQGNGVDVTTIGEATFGKGLGSTSRRALTLPFQKGLGEINLLNFFWFGPNHESILNDGVQPDVEIVESKSEEENDSLYREAILTILNKK